MELADNRSGDSWKNFFQEPVGSGLIKHPNESQLFGQEFIVLEAVVDTKNAVAAQHGDRQQGKQHIDG